MQRTLEILRNWETPLIVLFWYYVIAAIVTCLISTRCSQRRTTNPSRYRMIFAAALALVFTPSVITDFWLFMVPGPAIAGFLFLLPHIFTYPHLLLDELIYYVVPMALAFCLSYAVLLWLDKRRSDAPRTA
jgi:hypothetical protein